MKFFGGEGWLLLKFVRSLGCFPGTYGSSNSVAVGNNVFCLFQVFNLDSKSLRLNFNTLRPFCFSAFPNTNGLLLVSVISCRAE